MFARQLSIRDTLLLTIGALTLLIAVLTTQQTYHTWQRLTKIQSLQQATTLSDMLFDAMEELSVERDVAFAMLHSRDAETTAELQTRLKNSRREVDNALGVTIQILKRYNYPELTDLHDRIQSHLADIHILRKQIDHAITLPVAERDRTLAKRWSHEVTTLIMQTQDLWTGFIKHFTDINPFVTQHLRVKHFIRIITDYSGRERALIGQLIVENADPTPEELAQLLRGQGIIEISWRISGMIAEHSGLFPAIRPQFKDAQSHYLTMQDMIKDIFYVPYARHGASYPISVDFWFELSTQASDSLKALKLAAFKETHRYMQSLTHSMQREIIWDGVFLLLALGICLYSFRMITRRVIQPIHQMVEALTNTVAGKPVTFAPATDRQDEIGKLSGVLQAFQQNAEAVRLATAELKRSEIKLRAVVDHALDGLITINEKGSIESFNPACERIFGYRADEVIGQNVKILMPEPYHSEHDGYLSRYLRTGDAHIIGTAGREVRAKRKDGSIFPMDLSISAFQLADGKHFSGIIRDITVRKEAEANLLRYTRALERSNKELDDFAYIASHDLKEPLRGIHNHSRFLLEDNEDKLDPDSAGRLHRLVYLSQRMEKLVNDLLYFSRLGRQELAIQPTDINAVIHDIESTIDVLLEERHGKIIVPHTLPTITCDKPRVTEVFRNLIVNALKYNDSPEKLIEIGFLDSCIAADGTNTKRVFYVKDNGRGIPSEFKDEVFRIFKRLQGSKDGQEDGTGVGLTFVKKIIERHGGKIWLESEPGSGTTFYFTLEGQRYDSQTAA